MCEGIVVIRDKAQAKVTRNNTIHTFWKIKKKFINSDCPSFSSVSLLQEWNWNLKLENGIWYLVNHTVLPDNHPFLKQTKLSFRNQFCNE